MSTTDKPTWLLAERFRDVPAIEEAITNFAHDQTGDNATGIVLAVLEHQAATEAAKATGTAGEREVPSVQRVITQLETAERGFICPLCGKDYPHGHTPAEISIYRNGIKAGIHQKELAGAEHSRAAQNAGMDAGATGAGGRIGSHQRHEHRGRQSGNQRLDCGSDGACDGLPGSGEVREAVAEAARQPAPVVAASVDPDVPEALKLLSDVFDAWENGVDCYEEPDECAGFLGKAFRLDDDIFNRCVELLNRRNPPHNAASTALQAPVAINTWLERIEGNPNLGFERYETIEERAMQEEIADLRAALAARSQP